MKSIYTGWCPIYRKEYTGFKVNNQKLYVKGVQKPINVCDIVLSVVCHDLKTSRIIVLSKLSQAEKIIASSPLPVFNICIL